MTVDIDVLKEGIDSLIRAGYYRNREAMFKEAFRTMLEVKPSLKLEMAVELYKSEKISLRILRDSYLAPVELQKLYLLPVLLAA